MTHTSTETRKSSQFWTEPLLQVGAGMTILAIVLYESSNWTYGDGVGQRLGGVGLAVAAGVVLAVWAARRPETGTRRSGAFALTCGILGLVSAGATYLIEQAVQHAVKAAVIGPLASLAITLLIFGVVSLIAGVIKRINA